MKVETDEGTWEVRKPFAREIMSLSKLDIHDLDSTETFAAIEQILQKVIISGPDKYRKNGKYDLEHMPADIFFTLFFESCGSTLKVLQNESPR